MEVHVILGGPGCNKTGLLTELYAKCVNQYGWDKVAFISYTVAQVRRDKSKVKSMTKLSADKLDAFRTIHSAARQHYTEETVVIPEREFEGMSVFMDIDMTNIYKGIDYMRQLETKNMAVGANKAGLDTDNFKKCVYFYNRVKEKKSLSGIKVIDFSDMLKDAVDAHYKIDVDCAFIDECFAPNTKVRMADMSIKEIKDIKVGDFVMGTNGATKVTAIHKGIDTMYDVVTGKKQKVFTCNSQHLILQKSAHSTVYKWEHCEDIKRGAYTFTSRSILENNYIPSIDPYFFGLWLGNGFSREAIVVCNENDLPTINWLKSYGENLGDKVTLRKRTGIVQVEYSVHSKGKSLKCGIRKQLESYGFLLSKTVDNAERTYKDKVIPSCFMRMSVARRLALLAGLIDSDGMYVKSGNNYKYRIEMARKELMLNIYDLAASLGYYPTWYETEHTTSGVTRKYYRVDFFGSRDIPCLLQRKQYKRDPYENKLPCRIVKKGEGEYVGITVDAGDHLFVLANGVIVHNCQDLTPLQWRAIYTFFRDVKHLYVAGDPNQSLYRFNGGRPNYMLEMRYDDIKILNHSSRCSSNVMEMAFLVWKKMTNAAKIPISNGDTSGFGVFYPEKKLRNNFKNAIERAINKGEKVLVLANTYFQLVKIRDDILKDDLTTPHNFYSGRCKYHYKDRKQNVITFATVHQAKGSEADYVIYDVSYGRVYADHEYGCVEDRWQDYYRMVYTGITRAKKGIILCEVSPAVANEPSCKSFMFYSNYGLENYKKWLNAFLPSNTLTFDHLQLYSSK